MQPKLSILICAIPDRAEKREVLLTELHRQAQGLPVQIEVFETESVRKGGPSVGSKRNELLKRAKGDYICFIDDDDSISDDYVSSILEAMKTQPDAICFECKYTNKESGVMSHVYFSRMNLNVNFDNEGKRVRMINHLCPVRRDIVTMCKFPDASFSEDTEYGMQLRETRLIKREVLIPKILYYYNFSTKTSETWHLSPANNPKRRESDPIVKMDVIMVSDGRKPEMAKMTQKAIDSIAGVNANIIIVEKANRKYSKADVIPQQEPFNYNECLNSGVPFGNASLICFTNNDVEFPSSFMAKIVALQAHTKADVISVTIPGREIYHPQIISGYCFIMTRESYNKIGKLNEDFEFWCADNVTSEQIKEHGLKEFKSNIIVKHLCSASLNKLEPATKLRYTNGCVKKFNKKYKQNVLQMGV